MRKCLKLENKRTAEAETGGLLHGQTEFVRATLVPDFSVLLTAYSLLLTFSGHVRPCHPSYF